MYGSMNLTTLDPTKYEMVWNKNTRTFQLYEVVRRTFPNMDKKEG